MKLAYYSCFLLALVSCTGYKQNIMFTPSKDFVPDPIKREAITVEKNYVIQKNDFLKLDVFSNKGERLIDPNPELTSNPGQVTTARQQFYYLVDLDGIVKVPMVGTVKLEGLTLRQAEEVLQREYEKFFKEPFVILSYSNKRVIVLGAMGGQVIPLPNQNINLTEVLALAKGLPTDSKAQNIRVLRGEQVFIVDMSTIEGFKKGNLLIQPGDIIYVEPIRRALVEGLRDYAGIIGLLVSVTTLIFLVTNNNN